VSGGKGKRDLEFCLGVRVVGEWRRGHLFWGYRCGFCGRREFAD
jgi:hypothetical protein